MTQTKFTAERTLARIAEHWPQANRPTAQLMVRVYRLRDLVWSNAQAVFRQHGLSATGFEVLASLHSAPPPHEMRPTELQAAVLISSGGLTKVLYNLEAQGLIERPGHEGDRRSRPVRLTAKGVALAERAMASMLASERTLLARGLTAEEMAHLISLVRKLLGALEPSESEPVP